MSLDLRGPLFPRKVRPQDKGEESLLEAFHGRRAVLDLRLEDRAVKGRVEEVSELVAVGRRLDHSQLERPVDEGLALRRLQVLSDCAIYRLIVFPVRS